GNAYISLVRSVPSRACGFPIGRSTKSLLERTPKATRDGLKTPARLPASDETRSHGDLVLPRLQGRSRPDRRCGEGGDPRGLAVLQELQSSVRDQGRDPGPASPRFQMNSACAATTAVLSFADMSASSGSGLRARNCPPPTRFARLVPASSSR